MACGNDLRALLAVGDLETAAAFDSREDADEALGDLVPLGDGPSPLLLADGSTKIDVGAPGLVSHGLGVLLDPLGLDRHEPCEVLDPKALGGYESLHGIGPSQGQMAFEENAVEAGNRAGDRGLMLVDELFHGVLLSMAA